MFFFSLFFFLEANCSLKTSWMIDDTHSIALLTYSLIQIFFFRLMDLHTFPIGWVFFSVVKNCTGKLRNKKNFSWLLDFLKDFLRLNLWLHYHFFLFHSCFLWERKKWIEFEKFFLSILVQLLIFLQSTFKNLAPFFWFLFFSSFCSWYKCQLSKNKN